MLSFILVALLQVYLSTQKPILSPLPPRQDIVQTFLFDSTGPLTLFFKDTFCPGLATLIWDNDVFLGTTPSLQNFCGISASGFTSAIVSPQFTSGKYELAAGFHNLTVFIYASPTPNGQATLSINLFPERGAVVNFLSQTKYLVPEGFLNPKDYKNGPLTWQKGEIDVPKEAIQLL